MKGDRWTQELELGLVKLYKKFHCLWMMSSPFYNDLDRRYAAYVKIVEAFRPEFRSLTVPKVVYKIRDLRYRYCLELTKIERATACGENYVPNFSWFQVMRTFLDLSFRTDENKGDSRALFNGEAESEDDYNGVRLTSSTCRTIYENNLKVEESKSTVGEFEESGNDVEGCADVYDRRRRRNCRVEAEESEEVEEIEYRLGDFFGNNETPLSNDCPLEMKMMKKMTKTLLSVNEKKNFQSGEEGEKTKSTNELDEFDTFAMSIGSQLETLDPNLILRIEIMILTILNEERTKNPR